MLKELRKITVAFPEVACEPTNHGGHATFRVRKKVFAYFLNDHHGDGIISICFKGAAGEQAERIERAPKLYYSPAYIGPRGWIGLRLDQGKVNWRIVEQHLRSSYLAVAPKTLALKPSLSA